VEMGPGGSNNKSTTNARGASEDGTHHFFSTASGSQDFMMSSSDDATMEPIIINGITVSHQQYEQIVSEHLGEGMGGAATASGLPSSHMSQASTDEPLSHCRAYRNIPSNVSLSASLKYHRKELERQRAFVMLERTAAAMVDGKKKGSKKKRRKRRSETRRYSTVDTVTPDSVPASRRGSSVQPNLLGGGDGTFITATKLNTSSTLDSTGTTNAFPIPPQEQPSVGSLNRIAQGRELYSRPLAGQNEVDWNRQRLKSAKKGIRKRESTAQRKDPQRTEMPDMMDILHGGEHNAYERKLSNKRRAISLPAGALVNGGANSALYNSDSARTVAPLQRILSKAHDSPSSKNVNNAHTAPAPKTRTLCTQLSAAHLLSSKKRINMAQQRNIFERLSRLNSSLLDGIEEDISKRSTALKTDMELILRNNSGRGTEERDFDHQHNLLSKATYSPITGNPHLQHLRNHYRFKIQLSHDQDIRHLKYHIQFMDTDTRRIHREYNKTLSAQNSIVWNAPSGSTFRPFESFAWLCNESDMRNRVLKIQIKASIGRISPPNPDDTLEDEDDIFSPDYRGGVVDVVPKELVRTNSINFPAPHGIKFPTFRFKCRIAGRNGGATANRRSSDLSGKVHSRSILYRPTPSVRAPLSERLITDIPYTVSFSPFNEFSPYNPVAHRTADKKVPHAASARADSIRPDLSTKNPYAQLRKHPLFRKWKSEIQQPPKTAPVGGSLNPSVSMIAATENTQSRLRPVTVPTMSNSDLGFTEEPSLEANDLSGPPAPTNYSTSRHQESPPKIIARNRRGSIPEEFRNVAGLKRDLVCDLELVSLSPKTIEAAMAKARRTRGL